MVDVEVVAVLLGIALGTIAIIVVLRRGSAGRASDRTPRIDSFAVGEPWRHHVAAAQTAQRRFGDLVSTLAPGPLRVRMDDIGRQFGRGVEECWEIAKRGHLLDRTIRDLNGASLQARLDRSTDPVEGESLRSQIASVDRIRESRNDADEKLRLLQTRLGQLVTQAAEMTSDADSALGSGPAGSLGSSVDDVVTQLEALRLALHEVNAPGSAATE